MADVGMKSAKSGGRCQWCDLDIRPGDLVADLANLLHVDCHQEWRRSSGTGPGKDRIRPTTSS